MSPNWQETSYNIITIGKNRIINSTINRKIILVVSVVDTYIQSKKIERTKKKNKKTNKQTKRKEMDD